MIQICPLLYSSWPKRGCVLGRALSSLFSARNEKKNGGGGKERGRRRIEEGRRKGGRREAGRVCVEMDGRAKARLMVMAIVMAMVIVINSN